jgi:hypothetical protein
MHTTCYQEILDVKKVVKLIKIKVKLPIVLQMDNKGTKDSVSNWSEGGRTRHIDVCYLFFHEAKERRLHGYSPRITPVTCSLRTWALNCSRNIRQYLLRI